MAAVCLYGTNVVDPQQLSRLCAELRAAAPDLLLSVDEEGGDVTRLHYPTGSNQPGNAVLGRIDDTALTRESAAAIGRELTAYGINLDLRPSSTSTRRPRTQSSGSGAGLMPHVTRHAVAAVEGCSR